EDEGLQVNRVLRPVDQAIALGEGLLPVEEQRQLVVRARHGARALVEEALEGGAAESGRDVLAGREAHAERGGPGSELAGGGRERPTSSGGGRGRQRGFLGARGRRGRIRAL